MELTKEHFEEFLEKQLNEKFVDFITKDDLQNELHGVVIIMKKYTDSAVEELARYIAESVVAPMEQRFEKIDKRLEKIDDRFAHVDEKFARMDKLVNRVIRLETTENWKPRMGKMEDEMDKLKNALYLS